MTNFIQIEVSNPKIIQKGVEVIIDFYETLAIDKLNFSGLHVIATGVDSPFLNVVIDTRKNKNLTSEMLQSITNFFTRHKVEWVWFSTPLAEIDDLEQHNFKLLEVFPSMYLDLSQDIPLPDNNILIKEVDNNNNLRQWIEPLSDAFPSEDNGEKFRKLNENLLKSGNKTLRHFVAFYRDEPAAAATLFLSGDSVMLHNLGTKKAYRNLGLGKALALHRIQLAKKLGYKNCFLDASEEGFRLHKKLGFKVYSLTKTYILPLNVI